MTTDKNETMLLESLQNQLYCALKARSKILARMYLSGLQVLSQPENEDRFYLVAHAIREMMKKLPEVIDVPIEDSSKQRLGDLFSKFKNRWEKMLLKSRWPGDPKWQGNIDNALKDFLEEVEIMFQGDLEIKRTRRTTAQSFIRKHNYDPLFLPSDIEDLRIEDWMKYLDYFTATAHYKLTDEMTFFNLFKSFEYFLLNYLEPRTFEIQNEIQKIIEKGESTEINKELVKSAFDKIQRIADYNYFFENLTSTGWLQYLEELKQFDRPREPLREVSSIRYPFWAPARYLVKIASKKPDKVLEIILKITPTENPRVHEDLVEAALKMPPMISVKLYKKIIEWMIDSNANLLLLSSKVAAYVIQIQKGGFTKEALHVTKILLGFRKFEKQMNKKNLIRPIEPSVFSGWEYSKVLKEIASIFHKGDKSELIKLLVENLQQAILVDECENDYGFRDNSYIWHRSVEESDQNYECEIINTILNEIRKLSEELLAESPDLIESLCNFFRKKNIPIFSRMGIHLARLSCQAGLTAEFLLDQQLFDCVDVWHEYALLLETSYELLSKQEKETLLTMIAKKDNERSKYFSYYIIRKYLTEDEKINFEKLRAKYGEVDHPTFHIYTSGVCVGPTSPKSLDELKALSIMDLKKFLNEWSPSNQWNLGPSIEGLGRELEVIVSERIKEFLNYINEFKIQEKTYVRSIIQGFSKALAEKSYLNWDKVIEYLHWANSQQDEPENSIIKSYVDKDPSWSWTRKATCRLLSQALGLEKNVIPFELRNQVWNILLFGLSDVQPKEEEEDKYNSDNDYYQIGIESLRSMAIETMIHYAFWVKRNLGFTNEELPIEKASELFKVLEHHLDLNIDRSKAVRSIYGRWTPWLISLNRNWFQSRKQFIFPTDEVLRDYWAAAWDANILYNQTYINVFRQMKEDYFLAIDRIGTNDEIKVNKTSQRLVEHLIILFLSGEFEVSSEIITKLYAKLDVQLKKCALNMISRQLTNKKQLLDPKSISRSIKFWNFRVEECKSLIDPKDKIELSEFGWWFNSDHLDDEWLLDQAIEVLNLCHTITPIHMVMSRLLKLVDEYPVKIAEVLRLMVDYRVTEYGLNGWLEEAEILLSKLLVTDARETAIRIINKLGAYGFNQFGRY